MDSFIFLGTGDSGGVPRVYCNCQICEEARITGKNIRYRSSIMIQTKEGNLLLDCGPDWKNQMEQLKNRTYQHALITHAHFDHMAGLPDWWNDCRSLQQKGNVYAPADVLEQIRQQFPWLESQLLYHPIDQVLEFGGWKIKPLKVNHGRNGYSYAYLFKKENYSWAYCSDAIHLDEKEKGSLVELDLLILGTNFYLEKANLKSRSVYDMVEGMALVEELQPKQTYFTHMSHAVNVLENYPLPATISMAKQGDEVPLC